MKIAYITDIHFHPTQPGVHTGRTHALIKLKQILPHIQKMNPDLYVLGGDLISCHPGEFVTSIEHYKQVLSLFLPVKDECIVMWGNHEGKAFKLNEVKETLDSLGFSSEFTGSKEVANHRVIWVESHEITGSDGERRGTVLPESVALLKSAIESSELPVVVMFHHSPIPTQQTGNVYFEQFGLLEFRHRIDNYQELQPYLSNSKVVAVINGHTHWLSLNFKNNTPYLGVPSFSEHLSYAYSGKHELNPGSYAVIELTDQLKHATIYAGEYAYASLTLEK